MKLSGVEGSVPRRTQNRTRQRSRPEGRLSAEQRLVHRAGSQAAGGSGRTPRNRLKRDPPMPVRSEQPQPHMDELRRPGKHSTARSHYAFVHRRSRGARLSTAYAVRISGSAPSHGWAPRFHHQAACSCRSQLVVTSLLRAHGAGAPRARIRPLRTSWEPKQDPPARAATRGPYDLEADIAVESETRPAYSAWAV